MNYVRNVALTMALALAGAAAQAAPIVLDTGKIKMGVSDFGGLGENGVGLVGPTGDAITPGCLCEGWGASASGSSATTYGGARSGMLSGNTTATVLTGAGLSAKNVVTLGNGLEVVHSYSSAADGNLIKVSISLVNKTAGTLTDVRYARTLDWDVTPGYFADNYTTVYGGTPTGPGGKVLATSTNPFFTPDPLANNVQEKNINVVDSVGDKGGYFVFGFGDLAAGAKVDFDTYIGADATIGKLLKDFGAVGVEAYAYTTGDGTAADGSHTPAYGYGFAGLGLPPSLPNPVPEPASIALVGIALAGMAKARRRK